MSGRSNTGVISSAPGLRTRLPAFLGAFSHPFPVSFIFTLSLDQDTLQVLDPGRRHLP